MGSLYGNSTVVWPERRQITEMSPLLGWNLIMHLLLLNCAVFCQIIEREVLVKTVTLAPKQRGMNVILIFALTELLCQSLLCLE